MKNTTTTSKFPLPKDKGWVRLPERVEKLESSLSDSIRPYKVYTALLTQSGTNPPVATVLENTIGDIWFTYLDVGFYIANSNGLFKENKTATFITTSGFADDYIVRGARNDNNEVIITNIGISGNSVDSLYLTTIEIRVYN